MTGITQQQNDKLFYQTLQTQGGQTDGNTNRLVNKSVLLFNIDLSEILRENSNFEVQATYSTEYPKNVHFS